MHMLKVRNVNDALPQGLYLLESKGVTRESRAGRVRVMEEPVMTVYERPWERVLLDPRRDANPFFHLFESLWMLAGRNDIAPLVRYVRRMRSFSDDGKTQHGAYGHRWRKHFGADQLATIIANLRHNPDCRREVLTMWDPRVDLPVIHGARDVPCNTHAYVWVTSDERVNLTVCCRSNDVIWGAYGANAVHFSFLLQYVADALQRPVGRMYQLSNNFHAYEKVHEKLRGVASPMIGENPYQTEGWGEQTAGQHLFAGSSKEFDEDLTLLLEEDVVVGLRSAWLRRVAVPVIAAHKHYKEGQGGLQERAGGALEIVEQLATVAPDWHRACREWLERRIEKAQKADEHGAGHEQDDE